MPIDVTTASAEPVIDTHAAQPTARIAAVAETLMLVAAAVFLALHFVHLRADFPNHTIWGDWSKYTDEGWYGDAAIRQIQLGHWNLPGDFNPAAALPVLPAVEYVLFRFTGVSLVAARALAVALFGLSMVCCCVLMRRWPSADDRSRKSSLAPALVVLLLAVNPMCFAFSRLAILEPLLILLTLAALLVASAAGAAMSVEAGQGQKQPARGLMWAVVLGLLLPLMVLTKTSGASLFPAPFWMLWAAGGYRVKPFLRTAPVAGSVAAASWGGYYGLLIRPHYFVDYHYLFSANTFTGITRDTFWFVVRSMILDLQWIGELSFVLMLVALGGMIVRLCRKRMNRDPLTETLLVWIFGYAVFLAYHANLSPRYYVALAVPLTMLVANFFEPAVAGLFRSRTAGSASTSQDRASQVDRMLYKLPAAAAGVGLFFVIFGGARQTLHFVGDPEYSYTNAADQVLAAVERERAIAPAHPKLVMSISGAQLSLMTGLESMCDDFGTMKLPERVALYQPGWFVAWNDVEDDKMAAMTPRYRLVRVGAYPALDDPQRNLLILYRLDPVTSPQP